MPGACVGAVQCLAKSELADQATQRLQRSTARGRRTAARRASPCSGNAQRGPRCALRRHAPATNPHRLATSNRNSGDAGRAHVHDDVGGAMPLRCRLRRGPECHAEGRGDLQAVLEPHCAGEVGPELPHAFEQLVNAEDLQIRHELQRPLADDPLRRGDLPLQRIFVAGARRLRRRNRETVTGDRLAAEVVLFEDQVGLRRRDREPVTRHHVTV
mmetsp:Transcript_34592/g.99648  ORF Transcript_34592/g.99648 Transcript_34592/m.99648 type:complete len:214 (+) Transcript_34592:118-759(+)